MTIIQTAEGKLYSIGDNKDCNAGIGKKTRYIEEPTEIVFPDKKKIETFDCGESHIIAITTDGEAYGFGLNLYSQLGADSMDKEEFYSPVLITSSEWKDKKVVDVACGSSHNTFVVEG